MAANARIACACAVPAIACAVAAYHDAPLSAALLAALTLLPGALVARDPTGRRRFLIAAGLAAAVCGVFADCVHPDTPPWQVPATWSEIARLTRGGGALLCLLFLALAIQALVKRRDTLSPLAHAVWLLMPPAFNGLLALSTPAMMAAVVHGSSTSAWAAFLGRAACLVLFNELVLLGIGALMDRRVPRQPRLHALMAGCAVLVAWSPAIADFAAHPAWRTLPPIAHALAAPWLSAAAQCGLWAETFLVTGILLDALLKQRPTWTSCATHARSGLTRGAIYAGLFMALVQIVRGLLAVPGFTDAVRAHPALAGALLGTCAFPLGKTIVESFDGSSPFLPRLLAAYREPLNALRGAIAGLGIGLSFAADLPAHASGARFLTGAAIGALAYAGADAAWNLGEIGAGRRGRLQTWRVYALGAALGGFVGGALAWYLDTFQLAAVLAKFQAYAALDYGTAQRPVQPYVDYPLFSKYGAIDLGLVAGGVKQLYVESLSGVINWSLAAPLFGINLIALTALFERSWKPLTGLASADGVAKLVEQTVRVLRWGLWMAPVIYTFLRLAPDPTWYNQDGLVRTIVSIVQSASLSSADFRAWSLSVFLGLLAYDALRVLIWFDHMGLRVATLVNLSFVGGDALDEKAARFAGHAGRTRVIPEGIRRFLTWAPLLIPFYIPRGAEWDQVWGQADHVGAAGAPLLPAVATLLVGYRIAAGLVAATAVVVGVAAWRRRRDRPRTIARPRPFVIGNGQYTLEMDADGRGYSRCLSDVRPGFVLDLTRRPDDASHVRGKFVLLRELDLEDRVIGAPWSLTPDPIQGHAAAVRLASPTRLALAASRDGIEVRGRIEVHADEPVEQWRITIINTTDGPRRLELTTFQESALAAVDTYRRTPPFAAIHVASTFVRGLGALLVRNRLLKGDAAQGPISREVAFHATDAAERGTVRLVGYEDTRPAFLGTGTPATPAAFARGLRDPADEGRLIPFDPCAALRVHLDLEARGAVEVRFVDGYARDETVAVDRIARHLGRPLPSVLPEILARDRALAVPVTRAPVEPFSDDGWTVTAAPDEPRPWTHVIANPLGHGAVVSAEGAIFAFAGNAQQNALTPPCLDAVTCQQPGELMLVRDRDDGHVASPTWVPLRSPAARATTTFAPGRAQFHAHDGDLALTLDVFASVDAPVQFRRLRLTNGGAATRRLRVLAYAQIVLAEVPQDSHDQLDVRIESGVALYRRARNAFVGGWAFAACSFVDAASTTVRAHVIGNGGSLERPRLLEHGAPDETCADDATRCAAFCGELALAPGASTDFVLVLGQAADPETAVALARRWSPAAAATEAFAGVERFWRERLGVLRVDTGDVAFDRLVNVWLPYQVLASRLWGRVGPCQRSGATGFRDQLQDVLPFTLLDPAIARAQIVRHAAQQFREGDVVKWWHDAPDGRIGIAVRTRASDPHLWLPYVALRYVVATGDHAVLDEVVPFLEGPPVPRGKEGFMLAPRPTTETATVYEHCRRAVEHALAAIGAHGLPLMGSGDWNDGLDALGLHGHGESTWLAFFLHDVLRGFAPVAARRDGAAVAARYQAAADRLAEAAEQQWLDGGYGRGTDDEGRTLAYADALTAGWAVLSGAVGLERGVEALEKGLAVLERDTRVLLLAPAFEERSVPYPGRIAEYPAGVRENGGQYSHGVSWLVDAWLACAALARDAGRDDVVAYAQRRARELWWKISPLTKTTPDERARYGLSPHQQPADVYEGPGYEGRGGWSWYTGAAARMLSAAYAMLGIELVDGVVRVVPGAAIAVRSVTFRERAIAPNIQVRSR